LLGKSESISTVPELFAPVSKNDKLFTRKDLPAKIMLGTTYRLEQSIQNLKNHPITETMQTDFQKTADEIMLRKYTPPGVVVNELWDIVHFRGNTNNFLEQSQGKPTHNLLKMAKPGLGFELRNILHKAKKENAAVVKDNIPVQVNDHQHTISIEALPLPNIVEPHYLILFHDYSSVTSKQAIIGKKQTSKPQKDADSLRIKQLEQELAQTRDDMRSITEDQEAANEELQSANEELLSGSEEMQSLNEELETSKEELQSTNEELTVLNQELSSLNEMVTTARNYAEAIVATIRQPLLVLDKNLRVKKANAAFYQTFQVNEKETENVLIYDLGNKQWNIPQLRTLLEEILPQKSEFTGFEVSHNFTSIGERVILLNAIEIRRGLEEEKLILLAIEDITERKQHQLMVAEHTQVLEAKVNQRTLELSVANDELMQKNEELLKSNHELESFTYISSHDLQEPLRKIQTFAALILEKEYAGLSETGKDYFNRMHSAALRMQTLLQDLLTYSHTNITERKFETTDLKKIVEDVKKELIDTINEKKAVIDVEKLGEANINPFQFRQVMNNLITNSLKFSKPGVPPVIKIMSENVLADKLQSRNPDLSKGILSPKIKYSHISFSDNGIGFQSQYKQRIFDVFQRLHGKEEYPGTGIGLAIVNKIIENHNGYITATGIPGKGSTFDIYIPA
jgi:two-component system CheB/CheR fusion protein